MCTNSKKEYFEVLQSNNDNFPKGWVPLEELFDFNDVSRKPKMEPTEVEIEEFNIGSEWEPKMIKLSKALPGNIKQQYLELFREFTDVFAWSYEYLKSYYTEII